MKEKITDLVTNNAEIVVDHVIESISESDILKDIPLLGNFVGVCRVYRNYKDIRFANRLKKLIDGINSIETEYINEFMDKAQQDKDSNNLREHLINVLESSSEEEKSDLIVNLFKSFLSKKIDSQNFRRFVHLAERHLYSDLLWLNDFVGVAFESESVSLQSFVGSGLIEYAGADLGSMSWNGGVKKSASGNKYEKSSLGRMFCDAAFSDTFSQ